ncbi:MAG: proline--tRNA ligase [Gaiellaceae bacterium]
MIRATQLHMPTLREDPGDAEAASHRLLLRGGFIRQVGAGLYTFLPLGWRVHGRVVQIVREEMNAIGGQEVYMPLITPAELWQRSGRYAITEAYKLEDSSGRPFVLAMSHEETMALAATEIRSYRELPQIWYQFAVKARDEPRPRGGLLRVREFIMKDAYSFDRDEEGLDESFRTHAAAYRRIFERCGLEFYEVESDVGIMGGSLSIEFQAPCEAGGDDIAICERCDYKANVQVAVSKASVPEFERLDEPEEIETPGAKTIEALADFLGIDRRTTAKAMPVVSDGKLVLALVRGDHRLNEFKLTQILGGEYRPAHAEEIREAFGAEGGSLGPVGVGVEVLADETLHEGAYVVGANRNGWHLRGVEAGRDYQPSRFADLRVVEEGDACPRCGGTLRIEPAVEVGNIFKLGTRFSEALGANYLDESSREHPIVMGSYGIGPARTMAAVIEQHHDDQGICWPESVAPFDVHIVALAGATEVAEQAAAALEQAGRTVLLDDREARAGEKFADADLVGCPVRVTAGKRSLEDGAVDVRERASGHERRVPVAETA